jgi:dihydroorotate dehydrogenase electron transfer subunit
VRSADLLAGVEDFQEVGVDVRISTDDGTAGHHGLVTELLAKVLGENGDQRRRVLCCGPEPMMEAAAAVTARRGVPCEVSLETPMACGIGVCFSCVVKVRQGDGQWDYKRTCVEGPVFDAEKIVW